ncbi:gene transfer agent family protein [Microvirga arsenatis]|uniref:Gene transfer agent family protein n=1 Tax=Microvirga arsenatis TaxID=2692265 RepID=A0ABW9YYC8_9HYPH|nr:gene transfer agent family protein [Microvirga arsenatis]NBJ13339.1 gene transfer agent family protein [Microvirga arsenatis]NBJ24123.1 gene transfer agent family protein [Microvirga arsenatis]
MSSDASVSFDWADGEYTFRLAIGQLRELQDKTGVGPYALLARLIDGTWRVDDLRETIRLGLIGGKVDPLKALGLVRTYVEGRPLAESVNPAKAILSAAIFGNPEDPVGKQKPEETDRATDGSASPSSTDPEPSSGGQPEPSTN